MSLEELRSYKKWFEKSPGEVLEAVKGVGGWKNVFDAKSFPGGLPRWAHRVRNFFNLEPTALSYEQFIMEKNHFYKLYNLKPLDEGLENAMALSGDIYTDSLLNKWFQMSPGATVYHFKHNTNKKIKAAQVTASGQIFTPVFKLVAPDGSGGSRETIIKNPFKAASIPGVVRGFLNLPNVSVPVGNSTVGTKGETVSVINRIEDNPVYQGSYNYGETTVSGFDAHDKFDIKPHEKDEKGYLNPNNRFSSIFSRKFPEFADGEKTPLAEQEEYKKYP